MVGAIARVVAAVTAPSTQVEAALFDAFLVLAPGLYCRFSISDSFWFELWFSLVADYPSHRHAKNSDLRNQPIFQPFFFCDGESSRIRVFQVSPMEHLKQRASGGVLLRELSVDPG